MEVFIIRSRLNEHFEIYFTKLVYFDPMLHQNFLKSSKTGNDNDLIILMILVYKT